jgi:two-component system CheB/CheR fusion protein
MALFAVQNVIKDPPFTRLDLICCRNLLIYLDGDLQKRLVPLFHYTLNPGGLLLLGSSETLARHSDLFSLVDKKWKLFRRKDTGITDHRWEFDSDEPRAAERGPRPDANIRAGRHIGVTEVAERALLDKYAPHVRHREPQRRHPLHPWPHGQVSGTGFGQRQPKCPTKWPVKGCGWN